MTIVNCLFCNKEFDKKPAAIKRKPRHFCNNKCRGDSQCSKVDVV